MRACVIGLSCLLAVTSSDALAQRNPWHSPAFTESAPVGRVRPLGARALGAGAAATTGSASWARPGRPAETIPARASETAQPGRVPPGVLARVGRALTRVEVARDRLARATAERAELTRELARSIAAEAAASIDLREACSIRRADWFLDGARQRAADARGDIERLHGRVRDLERELDAAARALEEADRSDEAERSIDRQVTAFAGAAVQDQWLAMLDGPTRTAHEKVGRRFGLRASMVAKPGEISQDAFATSPRHGRFAIADGVTNSQYSGELARELVRRWIEQPPARGESFAAWLRPVQDAWAERIAPARARVEGRWFNRDTLPVGHSTFVGVALERRRSEHARMRLRVVAIGDSVLLQARQGRLVRAVPNERSADFRSRTEAIASRGEQPWLPSEVDLDVLAGDEVFMMTDAIGAWTLREIEAGRDPFPTLRGLDGPEAMERFAEQHRGLAPHGNQLEVDDTTVVRFAIPA